MRRALYLEEAGVNWPWLRWYVMGRCKPALVCVQDRIEKMVRSVVKPDDSVYLNK